MDSIDYKILKILQKNARETASNISKEIHLSVSAVIERIRKLEESRVIQEYTIIVDEKRTGNGMTALMEVSLEHPGILIRSRRPFAGWILLYPAIIRQGTLIFF